MKPGYQEQILYILNKHHSIVTIELGDAVTDDILQLIDSATREARIDELESAIVHIKTEAQTPMQYLERSLAQLKSNLEAK